MKKNRLLTLASVLDDVPAKKFDLDTWRDGTCNTSNLIKDKQLKECGFTACAIGLATSLDYFKDKGFKYDHRAGVPYYKSMTGFDAVNVFFEIDDDESNWLFNNFTYKQTDPKPKHVAARIRAFVSGEDGPFKDY